MHGRLLLLLQVHQEIIKLTISINIYRGLIKLFLLLLVCANLHAQEYAYSHYDTRDGLPSAVVYGAARDKDGFMWFATETGLSRFDGTQFRNFTIDDGLPDNEVLRVYVDSKNRVWIMPFRNAICYYYRGRIYNQANDPYLAKVKLTSNVTTVIEDEQHNILMCEARAVYLLRPDGSCVAYSSLNGNGVSGVQAGLNKQGNFVIAGGIVDKFGFDLMEMVNGQLMNIKPIDEYGPNSPNSVLLMPDLQVMAKEQDLHVFYEKDHYALPMPEAFVSITRLQDSLLALNTAHGTYLHNLKSGKIKDTLLVGKSVSYIAPDHEGNWWFCTQGQGIYRLISSEFQNYNFGDEEKASPVYSIAKFNGAFYFGSDRFRVMVMKDNKLSETYFSTRASSGRVITMYKPDPNTTIVGTDDALMLYENEKYVTRLGSLSVKSCWADSMELVVAAHTGVYGMNVRDLRKKRGYDTHFLDTLWRYRASSAWKAGNTVYVGTITGLYTVSNGITKYLGDSNVLLSRRINTIVGGSNGIVWIGTYGAGVVGVNDGHVMYSFSEKNGLSSNNCRAVYQKGDELWIGTEKGLNKLELGSQPHITTFTTADGLANNIINTIFADGDTIYVGTAEGLTRFNERKVVQRSTCIIKLTGIRSGQRILPPDTTNFIMPHKSQLRFEFSGISYKSSGDINYYFRMTGLGNQWQQTRSAFVDYQSLPSGSYTFECYAVNKYGVRSETVSVPFSIEQTLSEKWWFQVFAGLIVGGLIWMFAAYRIRAVRNREQAARQTDKRMVELEQMALKAQMNPHFIFNSLNSIQQYVLENDFRGVNVFITGFASLIRQTLDVSSKAKISLEDEVTYITTYLKLEKMRLEDKFEYEIHVADNIDTADYFIPPLILQPCLENSIRHGIRYRPDNDGKININILKDDDFLICIIEDNGVGRELAAKYKGSRHIEYQSRGMSLTATRIEMLSGKSVHKPSVEWVDVKTADGSVAGTRVIIKLPLEEVA